MNDESMRPVAAKAIELLRGEPDCAFSIEWLLDELGEKAPANAIELLDLLHELITDPQIDQVPDRDGISFAWVGARSYPRHDVADILDMALKRPAEH